MRSAMLLFLHENWHYVPLMVILSMIGTFFPRIAFIFTVILR